MPPKNRCFGTIPRHNLIGRSRAVRKHLRRRRTQHVVVGAVNDPTALGALQAFRDYGMDRHCAIMGQGAVAEARWEMRRPHSALIGSVAYFPESYGKNLIRIALEILRKQNIPLATFTNHELITPENVNEVYSNDLLMELKSLPPPQEILQQAG